MVDSSPWSPDTARLPIQTAFSVTYAAALETPSGDMLVLHPIAASVNYDSRRTPYVAATVTIAWPNRTTLLVLDPAQYDIRLRISAGYRRITTGINESYEIARLRVNAVTRDHVAQTVTIQASSTESVVIAQAVMTERTFSAATLITAGITQLITDALPGESPSFDVQLDGNKSFGANTKAFIGEDVWDLITEWADILQCKILHDGAGVWQIFVPPTIPSSSAKAVLNVGPRGSVTAATQTDDRGNALTDVVVSYAYSDAGANWLGYGIATTGETPRAVRVVKRAKKPVDPARAANNLLRRGIRRGHRFDITAAPTLWVRPYHTVSLTLPGGQNERVLVDSVTFDLDSGTMQITGTAPSTDKLPKITATGIPSYAQP